MKSFILRYITVKNCHSQQIVWLKIQYYLQEIDISFLEKEKHLSMLMSVPANLKIEDKSRIIISIGKRHNWVNID